MPKISDLPVSTALNSTDVVPIAQIGVTKKATVVDFSDFVKDDLSASNGSSFVGFQPSGTGGVTRTVEDKLHESFTLADFLPTGVTEDNSTDLTVYVQAAVDAAIANGAKAIELQGFSVITDEITINAPLVFWSKLGPTKAGLRQTTPNKNGLNFNFATYVQGGGIEGITIEAGSGWVSNGFQGTGSNGVGIRVTKSNGKFIAKNYGVHNFATSVEIRGCFHTWWSEGEHFYAANAALVLDTSDGTSTGSLGAGNSFQKSKYSNFGFTGTNTSSVGVDIKSTSGEYFDTIDITSQNIGVRIAPPSGYKAWFLFMSKVLADTNGAYGWLLDGSVGEIVAIDMTQCWASNCQGDQGVLITGSNVRDVKWMGGWIRDNVKEGVRLNGGTAIRFIGAIVSGNSASSLNTYSGFLVSAGVNNWHLTGCTIGNVSTAAITGSQLHNLCVETGDTSGWSAVGCDFSSPGTGGLPVANNSTSLDFELCGNMPRGTIGVNRTSGSQYSGTSLGTVAAGATVYMGMDGQQVVLEDSAIVVGRICVVSQFIGQSDLAPGAGETYTYTLMKNGVATSMTGSHTGTSSFQTIINGGIVVNPGDYLSIRLVGSAGAAAARHRWVLNLDS